MEQSLVTVLLTTCISMCLLAGSAAQDCSELIIISADDTEVLVNTSSSRTCLQCVDSNMMSETDTVWTLPGPHGGLLNKDSNPAPGLVELVDGVLVLLDPMQLLEDGNNAYRVDCQGVTFAHQDIDIYSSTFLPPTVNSEHMTFSEGSLVRVPCTDPNAQPLEGTIQWLDPHGNIAPTIFGGSRLQFLNISRIQAGDYVCQLTSPRNEILSVTVTITVLYPPSVASEDSPAVLLVPGTSTTLSCVATGLPTPTLTWHYQGTLIVNGTLTVVSRGNRSELTLPGELSTNQRKGMYRCTASNSEGSSSLEITAESPPDPVRRLSRLPSDTSISLNWDLAPDSRSSINVEVRSGGALVSNVTEAGTPTSLNISSLSPLTNYTFTVYAVNDVGRSEPVTVNATTLSLRLPAPVITSFQPLSVTQLQVTWEHPFFSPNNTTPPTGWTLELTPTGGEVQRRTIYDPDLTRFTFSELASRSEYSVRVAGENTRETGHFSNNATNSTDAVPALLEEDDASTAIIVSVLIIVLFTIVVGAVLVILLIRRRRQWKSLGMSQVMTLQSEYGYYTPEDGGTTETSCVENGRSPPHRNMFQSKDAEADFEKLQSEIPLVNTDIGAEIDIGEELHEPIGDKAPEVMEYKKEVVACEGRQVTLRVMFTGTPKPTVNWELEGKRVKADYAIEIGRDGSLFFICVEKKHSGRYCFQVSNRAGTVEGSISLQVKEEEGEEDSDSKESSKQESKSVKVEDFGDYVASMHSKNNTGFITQFQEIPTGENQHNSSIGKDPKNKQLNRFKNILPYDHNRVLLEPMDGQAECQSDYTNASPIDFLEPKTYIACQGPLPNTISDFWRMVWQEGVGTIAMVTNLQENNKIKCERYWPEMGSEQHGVFKLTLVETQTFADYVIRELQMEHVEEKFEPRKVTHFHFTSWPDHGVPEYAGPMLNFLKRVKSKSSTPRLVHCSAGVGRTGTMIAIDMALTLAPSQGTVDIPGIISKLRSQRMKMVQTADQYIFIHDAVLESLSCGDTQIPARDLRSAIQQLKEPDSSTGKTGFETQFQVLGQLSPKDSEVYRATALRYPDKNRSTSFLPPDKWRCCLHRQLPDYIHASYAHGYKQKKGYIVAQAPMENTVGDFWKLVSDTRCGVVVMLSDLKEEGEERCVEYWPSEGDSTEYGQYLVTTMKSHKNEGYTQRVMTVTNPRSRKLNKVTQFQLKDWRSDGTCSNLGTLIEVIDHMAVAQRRSGNRPILVHGRDTVSRVGVFCCLVNAIELCKTEGTVDVFQVVKALRIQKPGSVRTVQQYSFIFEALLLFLDSFSIYENFK